MTLSGLRSLDKSAIVCFLFVVSGKREPQSRKLLVSFEPAKAFLGFVHGRSGPAQSHRGRTPVLHIAGDTTHGAHHIFDDVRRTFHTVRAAATSSSRRLTEDGMASGRDRPLKHCPSGVLSQATIGLCP